MYEDTSLEHQIKSIYRQHYQDVYQFLLYFTGNQNDAEDLTQEVFIRVLKAFPTFHYRSSIKTWILSIAKRVAVDQYRKKRIWTIFADALVKKLQSTEGLPDEMLEAKEEWETLEAAMNKLKPIYRMVVILRGIKDLSIQETALILGCSEAKVKVNYHRAIKMLQNQLAEQEQWRDSIELSK